MNGTVRILGVGLVCGIILNLLGSLPLRAQEIKHPPPNRPARAPTSIWKSQTTGREYRVRVEKDHLYAEWVNIGPDLARHGAYIRTECRRVGSKWVGTSRNYLPCTLGEGAKEHIANWCHLLTRIEFDSITPDRITGRGEALRRFDCQRCKILETVWANFVWVPKR